MTKFLFEYRRPETIFQDYLEKFPSLGLHWYEKDGTYQSNKIWTKRNLDYFYQMGKKRQFDCWTSKHEGEYQVDLCWYVGYPPDNAKAIEDWYQHERYMELALEHELSGTSESIYYAFSKLVDIKALTKIFMFSAPPALARRNLPQLLSHVVSLSSIKVVDENYLLIMFSEDKTKRDIEKKPEEALRIDGNSIDNEGEIKYLGNGNFPIAPIGP